MMLLFYNGETEVSSRAEINHLQVLAGNEELKDKELEEQEELKDKKRKEKEEEEE